MQNLHKPERNIHVSLKKYRRTTLELDFYGGGGDVLTKMRTAHFKLHFNFLVVAVGMCWNDTNLHQEISQRLIAPVHAAWNASLFPLHLICSNKRWTWSHTKTFIYPQNRTKISFAVGYDIRREFQDLLRVSYSLILSSTWLWERPLEGNCLV